LPCLAKSTRPLKSSTAMLTEIVLAPKTVPPLPARESRGSISSSSTQAGRAGGTRGESAPGATKTSSTRGLCASFHARACSRPPLPMRRMRSFCDRARSDEGDGGQLGRAGRAEEGGRTSGSNRGADCAMVQGRARLLSVEREGRGGLRRISRSSSRRAGPTPHSSSSLPFAAASHSLRAAWHCAALRSAAHALSLSSVRAPRLHLAPAPPRPRSARGTPYTRWGLTLLRPRRCAELQQAAD